MDKDHIETIRNNVKRLMEMRGIASENSLAVKSGISQKTVNLLLATDAMPNPTVKVLAALSKTLGVVPWMLLVRDFPFEVIGLGKPLARITAEGYRLLSVYESLPDDKRKAILDFVLFQLGESSQAKQIRDTRSHYKSVPSPTSYPRCDEDFE